MTGKHSTGSGRISLTGFGPFADVVDNPSQHVVEALDGSVIAGCSVVSEVLEVSFSAVRQAIPRLVSERPAALVLLGVARRAERLRVESLAVNRMQASVPDTRGVRAEGQPVESELSLGASFETNVASDRLVERLRSSGVDVELSRDAGRYVCNAVYFHALRQCLVEHIPCVFVHVPRPEHRERTESGESGLDGLVADVRCVMEHVMELKRMPPP